MRLRPSARLFQWLVDEIGEATIRDVAIGIAFAICTKPAGTIVLSAFGATFAVLLVTVEALRTNTYPISDSYALPSLFAHTNRGADNLVPNTARV
ncbi:MAG: hypothetical protein Q9201_004440 [Fulgogasparrea decipioides]